MKFSLEDALIRIVIDQAIFLEFSCSDILDEDAAVQALEQIASTFQKLPKEEKERMGKAISRLSVSYNGQQLEFVLGLMESFGVKL
jgi:hypothetical protein